MDEVLPAGIDTLDLITGLFSVAAFIIVFVIWNALVVRDPMRSRVRALQARRDELKAGFLTSKKRVDTVKKVDSVGFMRTVVDKLKLAQTTQTEKMQLKLVRAGFRSRDAIIVFLFFKLVLPIIVAIGVVVYVFGFRPFAGEPMKELAVVVGTIVLAFMLPDIIVKNFADKRRDSIRKALPDALDLMVICAEAGLTLDAALNRVAKEMANASAELADEVGLTAIELGFLTDRKTALNNWSMRVDLQAVRGVVTTLIQTERYGTPLAQSLRVLSAEYRNERMMAAEEKAARLPALMTIPLILFILPVLFIVLMGPATCRIVDTLGGDAL